MSLRLKAFLLSAVQWKIRGLVTGLNKGACLRFNASCQAPNFLTARYSKGCVRQTQEVNEIETGVFSDGEPLGLFRDVICGVNILPVCPVIST